MDQRRKVKGNVRYRRVPRGNHRHPWDSHMPAGTRTIFHTICLSKIRKFSKQRDTMQPEMGDHWEAGKKFERARTTIRISLFPVGPPPPRVRVTVLYSF